jgi:spore coat protein U-like protein
MATSNLASARPTRRVIPAAVAFVLLPAAAIAGAVQTASMSITLTNPGICTVTASTLSFPVYTGVLSRATTTVAVTCSNSIAYSIALSPGLAPDATVSTRRMTEGGEAVNYALFSDSAYSQNWGQTIGTDTVGATGTGTATPAIVYGQIAAGQYVAPGTYSDTVTATVSY